jgi:outer membrane cobalamin receptor
MKISQKNQKYKVICICICLSMSAIKLCGQEKTDTIRTYTLREVNVEGEQYPVAVRSTSPVQVLKKEMLEKLNVLQLSDAAKFLSGVQIKDYGGVGGMKTISVRGLGATHSLITYDGLAVSDYQTGQMDIGRFSLENIEMIRLNIGESDDIFRSARDLSAAGALHITTRWFTVDGEKKRKIWGGLRGGSFGLFNPSVSYEQRLHRTFRARVSAEYLQTQGDYPYTTVIGEKKIRENADVRTFNTEANLQGNFNNGGRLSFKMYAYDSDHSLPGAYRFYSTSPGEQVKDRTFFAQGAYEQKFSSSLWFRSAVKATDTHTRYIASSAHSDRYLYDQREYYATATLLYHAGSHFSVSWANDGSFSSFRQNLMDKKPERTLLQSALSAKYQRDALSLNGSLFGAYAHDRIRSGDTKDFSDCSPYLGFSVTPIKNVPWQIRGFYKQTFRQPTFSDLYALPFVNKKLDVEKAVQYDLGMTWVCAAGKYFPSLSVVVDAYWNRIRDKIIAFPGASMYIYTIQNIGKVEAKGVDIRLNLDGYVDERFSYRLQASYSCQQALDRTEPGTAIFNHQIPYTPYHTSSGYATFEMPWFNVNYTLLFCGERYFNRVNLPEYRMDAYLDQGISLDKTLHWKETKIKFLAECLNLYNRSYEVVRSYPMPGRSFRATIKIVY